jgi:hypothetical protein
MPAPNVAAQVRQVLQVLYQILVVGQSRGNGADGILPAGYVGGGGAVSTIPFYKNSRSGRCFMLNGGVRVGGDTANGITSAGGTATAIPLSGYTGLLPLTELTDATPHSETIGWGLAYYLAQRGINVLVTSSCGDGLRYNQINQGSQYYNNALDAIRAGKKYANAMGMRHEVLCVVAMNGEADQAFAQTGFDTNMATLRTNYQTDIKGITGQSNDIPMYHDQQISGAPNASGVYTAGTGTALKLYELAKANPTTHFLVGTLSHGTPRQLDGSSIHWSPWFQRFHGEDIGRVIYRNQFLNLPWRGVVPIAGQVNFDGTPSASPSTTIVANFYVPEPPLQLAFDYVGRVSSPLYGLTYIDDGTARTVTAATVTGPAQLTITLSGIPDGTAASRFIGIAYGSSTGTNCGPFRGDVRSNLCDSGREVSYDGTPLRTWASIVREALS